MPHPPAWRQNTACRPVRIVEQIHVLHAAVVIFQDFLHPCLIPAQKRQILPHEPPGGNDGNGQLPPAYLHAGVLCGRWFVFRIQERRNCAARLQNGVLHLRKVRHALNAQIFCQLVGVHARLFKILLQKPPVFDQNNWFAAQKPPHAHAPVRQHGQNQFHAQNDKDRQQSRQQRRARLLHRHGGQIRDQHRHNELHRLHLAQLPLAHEPDDEDQRQI